MLEIEVQLPPVASWQAHPSLSCRHGEHSPAFKSPLLLIVPKDVIRLT